ncbi:response regulator [Spirosoma taeanense]|uniref:Response regulator n=1 Tax=Spirosoma taeanense TaxID=2735870 RepID=A0A6M5Y7W0_9BACT|nr:response regulator [Spirosoma taeanense]QJW89223.1 response regulator [Spirosoma taeanense]
MELLLVDDDATDRELFAHAVSMTGKEHKIQEAQNGEVALQYLHSANHLPDLIILDLNMPIKDGRETLAELKASPRLRNIPVCIMSTSSAPFDIESAYNTGANLFLVKPFDFKKLIEMLTSLLTLFSTYVTLPNRRLS